MFKVAVFWAGRLTPTNLLSNSGKTFVAQFESNLSMHVT